MAELAVFPDDCQALIVEPEPIQAMTLECLLEEFGCRRMGPAATLVDVEKLLDGRRPSFALVAADLAEELEPVTAVLDREQIPFALLAVGPDNEVVDRSTKLRSRPRVRRPYHAPSCTPRCARSNRTIFPARSLPPTATLSRARSDWHGS